MSSGLGLYVAENNDNFPTVVHLYSNASSQVSSIDTVLAYEMRVRVPTAPLLMWKLSVLEIPLDTESTANCLVENRTRLGKLIPAAIVLMRAD